MRSITAALLTGLSPSASLLTARQSLADSIRKNNINANVLELTYTDNLDLSQIFTPIILIGHSFGGDQCLSWINKYPEKIIDCLFLLDPVPQNLFTRWFDGNYDIPMNVSEAICWHRSGLHWPLSKGINASRTGLQDNILNIEHDDFYSNTDIISAIFSEVSKI